VRQRILDGVRHYYGGKVSQFGPTPRGADWNSRESQVLRFEQLLKVAHDPGPLSLNDYGCGYGALLDYLADRGYVFRYTGYDISREMINEARKNHGRRAGCRFLATRSRLTAADYTVASGIFNVRLSTPDDVWRDYIYSTLHDFNGLSEKGFAFNALTSYADRERMRTDLYYADPALLFDYCKRHFSRFVSLIHDYPLYEFTILVRKQEA
jgi:SAM-dependent methyltransferase